MSGGVNVGERWDRFEDERRKEIAAEAAAEAAADVRDTVDEAVAHGYAEALATALAAHLGQKLVAADAEVSPAGWRARDYEPVDGSSGSALLNSDGSWTASVRRDGRSGYADGETAADAVGAAVASHEGEGEPAP